MDRPKILVTGATGKTGTAIPQCLRQGGWLVRAQVPRIDARGPAAAVGGRDGGGLGARMAVLPLVPGLDIDAHGFPVPPAPRLSVGNARWRGCRRNC